MSEPPLKRPDDFTLPKLPKEPVNLEANPPVFWPSVEHALFRSCKRHAVKESEAV